MFKTDESHFLFISVKYLWAKQLQISTSGWDEILIYEFKRGFKSGKKGK